MRTHYLLVAGVLGALLPGAASRAQAPSFAAATSYATAAAGTPGNVITSGLTLADVTGDGRPDVVTTTTDTPNNYAGSAVVLPGTASGSLQARTSSAVGRGTAAVVAADLNGDGRPDLVTADRFSFSLGVLLNAGAGTWQPAVAYTTGTLGQPQGVAVADVNGDGKPDLLTVLQVSEELGVLLGNGNGTFQAMTTYALGSNLASDLAVADFNADGKLDVVVGFQSQGRVAVLRGNGSGAFQAASHYLVPGSGGNAVAVADFNADGRPDVVTDSGNNVGVLLNANGAGFQQPVVYPIAGSQGVFDVAVADVTGDGRPDVLTANPPNIVSVLPGNSGGTLGAAATYAVGSTSSFPECVAAADLNADGRPDIVTANLNTNTMSVLLNTTPLAARPALPEVRVALVPNPADAAGATLTLAGLPAAARVQATLLDATGRALPPVELAAAPGTARTALPLAGLPPGLYLLRLAVRDQQGTLLGALPAQRLQVR